MSLRIAEYLCLIGFHEEVYCEGFFTDGDCIRCRRCTHVRPVFERGPQEVIPRPESREESLKKGDRESTPVVSRPPGTVC